MASKHQHTLSKVERLKSRTLINELFSNGKSLFAFPLKLIYLPIEKDLDTDAPFLFSVTVPKRIHRKAHIRNLLKRRVREAYRQNKMTLEGRNDPLARYALMYLLVDKEVSEYALIDRAIKKIHGKFEHQILNWR